jgi:hypothetical protein
MSNHKFSRTESDQSFVTTSGQGPMISTFYWNTDQVIPRNGVAVLGQEQAGTEPPAEAPSHPTFVHSEQTVMVKSKTLQDAPSMASCRTQLEHRPQGHSDHPMNDTRSVNLPHIEQCEKEPVRKHVRSSAVGPSRRNTASGQIPSPLQTFY